MGRPTRLTLAGPSREYPTGSSLHYGCRRAGADRAVEAIADKLSSRRTIAHAPGTTCRILAYRMSPCRAAGGPRCDLVDGLPHARRRGRRCGYLVPDGVVQYINKYGLYRSQPAEKRELFPTLRNWRAWRARPRGNPVTSKFRLMLFRGCLRRRRTVRCAPLPRTSWIASGRAPAPSSHIEGARTWVPSTTSDLHRARSLRGGRVLRLSLWAIARLYRPMSIGSTRPAPLPPSVQPRTAGERAVSSRIVPLRHGQTDLHVARRFQARSAPERGRRSQAQAPPVLVSRLCGERRGWYGCRRRWAQTGRCIVGAAPGRAVDVPRRIIARALTSPDTPQGPELDERVTERFYGS